MRPATNFSVPSLAKRRRGTTVFEVAAAVALLAVVMVMLVELAAAIEHHRRASEFREQAIREANNLLERTLVLPWNELESAAKSPALSDWARETLREPRASLEISVAPADPDLKRVRVTIDWLDRAGIRVVPVRLQAWKFRSTEASP